jgi:hypothetical protein
MRCRRICRELLWLARFGELGPSSQPHLDHLAGCQSCRDEVGYDRQMVRQLRVALAARIEGMQPSPRSWDRILARAQAPEPTRLAGWWSRSLGIVSRLRTSTAMAGTGLALILALNMEVIPVAAPSSTDAVPERETAALEQIPRMPVALSSPSARIVAAGVAPGTRRTDPEAAMTTAGARVSPPRPAASVEEEVPPTEFQVVFRPLQSPEPHSTGGQPVKVAPAAPSVPMEAGQPS